MTEKAAVEVPAPVSGRIVSTTGQPGDMVAVGSELVVLETASAGAAAGTAAPPPSAANGGGTAPGEAAPAKAPLAAIGNGAARQASSAAPASGGGTRAAPAPDPNRRVLTSPAIRRRAKEAGIDLRQVAGSGPQGRIGRQDFEAYAAGAICGPRLSGCSDQLACLTCASSGATPLGRNGRDQSHRLAAAHRAADERRQAQHPTLRLCRRGGCDGAGVAAATPQHQGAAGDARRSLTCPSWRSHWCGSWRSSRNATLITTRSGASSCVITRCISASRRRRRKG